MNSIATIKGGTHVQYITDQITQKVVADLSKKNKARAARGRTFAAAAAAAAAPSARALTRTGRRAQGGAEIKPFNVKNHMRVFVNCQIENPTFDSQTKETLTTKPKDFGSTAVLEPAFLKAIMEQTQLVMNVMLWLQNKQNVELKKKGGSKRGKLVGARARTHTHTHTRTHTRARGVRLLALTHVPQRVPLHLLRWASRSSTTRTTRAARAQRTALSS